jgi:hypothetical protein
VGGAPQVALQRRGQIVARQRPGNSVCPQLAGDLTLELVDHRVEQRPLGGEMVVKGPLGDSGPGRHVIDRYPGVPRLGHQRPAGPEDPGDRALAALSLAHHDGISMTITAHTDVCRHRSGPPGPADPAGSSVLAPGLVSARKAPRPNGDQDVRRAGSLSGMRTIGVASRADG